MCCYFKMYPSKFQIEVLNKDFLQKVISEAEQKEKFVPAYTLIRKWALLGFLDGVFPISNVGAKKAEDLKFKKLSWAYIFSWLMLSFKVFGIIQIAELIDQYNSTKEFKFSPVDTWAGYISFAFVFGFGLFAHLLSSVEVPKLLDAIQSVEKYDEKYSLMLKRGARCFMNKVMINTTLGILISVTPLGINIAMFVLERKPLILSLFFGHFWTTNRIIISVALTVVSFVLEFGVMFLFAKIFGFSAAMVDRLVCLTNSVEEKSEAKNWALGLADKSWLELSHQYLEFHRIFGKYEKSFAFYFVLMFPALIVGSVCTIYFAINSESPVANESWYILLAGIGICCYRIYALADCGETLERKYRLLVKLLLKVNQESKFLMDEKKQFKQFLKLVKTIPISLSAGGYFTVNRNNVTSIAGVILTYIIVLLQFNMSNPISSDNKGLSLNTSTNTTATTVPFIKGELQL